jgi:hypothetical protein
LDAADIRPFKTIHDKRKLDNIVGDNLVQTWIRGKEVIVPLFFLEWMRTVRLDEETNISLADHLISIWVLSDWLVAPAFSRVALGLITWAEQLDFDFLNDVYDVTLLGSPLRLYSIHFARYCAYGFDSEDDKNGQMCAELKQDMERRSSVDMDSTRDPRGLPVEHWFSECGRSSKSCRHSLHWEAMYPDKSERTAVTSRGQRVYPISLYMRS